MKLIIQNNQIIGTATDAYTGPDEFMTAPEDYDPNKTYIVVDGVLVEPVPQTVSMRQARLALHRSNLLANVDAALASLPEPEKSEAQIEWEYATTVERNSPLVSALSITLSMTDAQLDELFITAATI